MIHAGFLALWAAWWSVQGGVDRSTKGFMLILLSLVLICSEICSAVVNKTEA
jgi:hypothetical protein